MISNLLSLLAGDHELLIPFAPHDDLSDFRRYVKLCAGQVETVPRQRSRERGNARTSNRALGQHGHDPFSSSNVFRSSNVRDFQHLIPPKTSQATLTDTA